MTIKPVSHTAEGVLLLRKSPCFPNQQHILLVEFKIDGKKPPEGKGLIIGELTFYGEKPYRITGSFGIVDLMFGDDIFGFFIPKGITIQQVDDWLTARDQYYGRKTLIYMQPQDRPRVEELLSKKIVIWLKHSGYLKAK